MDKQIRLAIALVIIVAVIVFLQSTTSHPLSTQKQELSSNSLSAEKLAEKKSLYSPAAELVNPSAFINTNNFTLRQLVGRKVVLLDFWTYSCINCQRTIPFLNAWYEKYKAAGFEIVGVHTPEFEFEKDYANVKREVEKFGIKYPVVMDNEYGTWSAYNNRYWPAEYLIDIDGFVVSTHFGEGNYDETEGKIVALLKEKAERMQERLQMNESVATPAAQQPQSASPETYFGAARNEFLANGEQAKVGVQTMVVSKELSPNQLYLGGQWEFSPEYAQSKQNASIAFVYYAKSIFLVASADNATKIVVTLDGKPVPREIAGQDVAFENGESIVIVKDARLYSITREEKPAVHAIEMAVGNGVRAYTFTFG